MHEVKLETQDLLIRKAVKSDFKDLLNNYWSKPKTARLMLWKPIFTPEEAVERTNKTIEFEKDKPCFVIEEKESHQVIGMVGFIETEKDIYEDCGIGIGCDFVGKGYGKQTLSKMLEYLFVDCKAQKVIYTAMQQNMASISLQEKFGFKYVQSMQKVRTHDNFEYIINMYELTKEDYFKNQEK
ncbi:MAG: GNAT family N-acetyltransferase [Clostridia bacterium]|nr:GNAT family N-acetyltransferase [Clostridia bacterium]